MTHIAFFYFLLIARKTCNQLFHEIYSDLVTTWARAYIIINYTFNKLDKFVFIISMIHSSVFFYCF